MTTAQKVIKYFAIGVAAFIIFAMITSIIALGSGLTSLTGGNESGPKETYAYTETEVSEIKKLNIDLGASSLKIKKGDALKVEENGKHITVSKDGDELEITEDSDRWFTRGKTPQVVIYIPEDFNFEEASIKTGAGRVEVENILADKLKLNLGAGKTEIANVVSNEAKIETGAGELVIRNGKLNDAKIKVGVGKLDVTSEFTGDAKIETGIGANIIKLLPTENDYKIEFHKGIGSIKYNGKNVSSDSIEGEGSNFIKIDGGIGSINVKSGI